MYIIHEPPQMSGNYIGDLAWNCLFLKKWVVFFFWRCVFTKGRNFASLCETGIKKKPARAYVFATRGILVYLYTGLVVSFY